MAPVSRAVTALGLTYVVDIQSSTSLWPPMTARCRRASSGLLPAAAEERARQQPSGFAGGDGELRGGEPHALLADLFAGDDEATACSSNTLN